MQARTKQWLILTGIFLGGVFLGWLLSPSVPESEPTAAADTAAVQEGQIWTCSMHPQIRQNKPGKCPICGMDLIPLETEQAATTTEGIPLSSDAIAVANIRFAVAERRKAEKVLRLPAVVAPDERKLLRLTSHVPSARIESLYVNFEGAFVRKGEPVAKIYSPEIIAAHRELLIALQEKQPVLLETIRQKFRNWKFTEEQIAQLERTKQLQSTIEILSPVTGHVLKLNMREGDHPMEGAVIMEIADLSTVWVWLDVYEQDLPLITVGMPVSFQFDAVPGKIFKGTVAYIEPTVNEKTRSVPVQVVIPNPALQLRPGMYGVATVHIQQSPTLVIPKSAVLWTGERSLVYVKAEEQPDRVIVVPREVRLGADLKDVVEVVAGLSEGEEVVAYGTFIVDASAQLAGFPSMMNPTGGQSALPHHHGGHTMPMEKGGKSEHTGAGVSKIPSQKLDRVLRQYEKLTEALIASSLEAAQQATHQLYTVLQSDPQFQPLLRKLKKPLEALHKAKDLKSMRVAFDPLSRTLYQVFQQQSLPRSLYLLQCPMAFENKEGYWLSSEPKVRNPYFGAEMLECGSVVDTLRKAK